VGSSQEVASLRCNVLHQLLYGIGQRLAGVVHLIHYKDAVALVVVEQAWRSVGVGMWWWWACMQWLV
jgi:hypothetical protein